MEELRVLLIAHRPEDARLYSELLQEAGAPPRLEVQTTLTQAVQQLGLERFDIALFDPALPDGRGDEGVPLLCARFPALPVIVLPGGDDRQQASRMLQLGAQDYLNKSQLTAAGLVDAIRHAIERHRLIVEQRRISAELERACAELKSAQSQMLQREKMASIGQLAAGVAHEINNPVGFIKSNLNTLKRYLDRIGQFIGVQDEVLSGGGDPSRLAEIRRQLKVDHCLADAVDLLDESQEGVERVQGIVRNLKSFSRVDDQELAPADLNECLENTINIVWNELKYKAKLTRDYGELPSLRCYPQQLNQVFMNLLVNAAHAIREQGEIEVSTRNELSRLKVSIRDTGSGIAPEVLPRIFEPFFTTKPVGKGTGLGLSIAYDIVKKHGGELNVETVPGQGTTFSIHLPLPGVELAPES